MIHLTDIHPLADFLRNHREHVERLQKLRRPEVLTINGKAALVVQDAETYQQIMEDLERAETLAGIRRGLNEMEAGEGRPAQEFFDEMKQARGVPDLE